MCLCARSDLKAFVPPDFSKEPAGFLPKISDAETRAWALAVHRLWAQLCRKVCLVLQIVRGVACVLNVKLTCLRLHFRRHSQGQEILCGLILYLDADNPIICRT